MLRNRAPWGLGTKTDMIYLLDTDHFSILQRKGGAEFARLSIWMAQFAPLDFGRVSGLTVEERAT